MKKRLLSTLLALCMMLALLPETAHAAEALPDWYFLFAIFKNVDADAKDWEGKDVHARYSMPQDEINAIRDHAQAFVDYMNQLGVMRAHAEVVEINETVTELGGSEYGSWIGPSEAAPFLEGKVDLDRYDHVFGVVSLNVTVAYAGLTGAPLENGTGYSCVHFVDREDCLEGYPQYNVYWTPTVYVHEYLHFVEQLSRKFGTNFDEHATQDIYDSRLIDGWKACYTDIILNRVNGNDKTGTGAPPFVWQCRPQFFRATHELIIPDGVTNIPDRVFSGHNNLERVVIPSGVTSIGDMAFQDCTALANVNIPSSLKSIGNAAFERCTSLTEITLPSSVISIGEWAFQGCTALTNVIIPGGVASIRKAAFYNCSNLKNVTLSNGVTSIDEAAFRNCSSMQSIAIPSSVTSIGVWAFADCGNLKSVVISRNLANIGDFAFAYCSNLQSVTYPGGTVVPRGYSTPDSVAVPQRELIPGSGDIPVRGPICGQEDIPVCEPPLDWDPVHSRKYVSGLATMASSASGIGGYAFVECASLETMMIPSGITWIDECAFYNCGKLKGVTIPSGVTSIGDWSFGQCGSMESIAIPSSVSSIGYAAFWDNGVRDVYYSGTESQWRSIQFDEFNDYLLNAAIHYNSTIPGGPDNGGKLHGKVQVSAEYAPYGEQVRVTLTPDSGYKSGSLTVVTVNGKNVPVTGRGNSYTFSMPAADVTLYVEFVESMEP